MYIYRYYAYYERTEFNEQNIGSDLVNEWAQRPVQKFQTCSAWIEILLPQNPGYAPIYITVESGY